MSLPIVMKYQKHQFLLTPDGRLFCSQVFGLASAATIVYTNKTEGSSHHAGADLSYSSPGFFSNGALTSTGPIFVPVVIKLSFWWKLAGVPARPSEA